MGWWSAEILGGDTPMDAIGMLLEKMGSKETSLPDRGSKAYETLQRAMRRKMDVIKSAVERMANRRGLQDGSVLAIAYAFTHMEVMPDAPLQAVFLKAAMNDEWRREGHHGREKAILQLTERLDHFYRSGRSLRTFRVGLSRVAVGFASVDVTAETSDEAVRKALDKAGDLDYTEKSADYNSTGVRAV